jgi:uncharacterized membrane protein (DUF2068 family)
MVGHVIATSVRSNWMIGQMSDVLGTRAPRAGLRTVAIFEAIKGALVIAAACGLLTLLHKDVADEVARLVDRVHLNPEGHVSQVVLRAATNMTDAKLLAAAAAAVMYSVVRFIEAYGLWNGRIWAQWFALLSGSMYLPGEMYEVMAHFSRGHLIFFGCNLTIVLYMLYVRLQRMRS